MSLSQLTLAPAALAGLYEITRTEANELLTRWGHYLGPCHRPFGQQHWALIAGGRPVSVAVSASTVSSTITAAEAGRTLARGELVELARLCSAERWASRVMLRLWREVAAPAWPHWVPAAAVAYSQNDRHDGRIYRFDGWTRIATRAGSTGGGQWTRPRAGGDAARGAKTLWLWTYTTQGPNENVLVDGGGGLAALDRGAVG